MTFGVPQIIFILLVMLNLGIHLAKHGEEKEKEEYNFFHQLLYKFVLIVILYKGGFFS